MDFIGREMARARAVTARFGPKTTLQKVVMYPARAAGSQVKYWAYQHRYPTNVIFIASLAKSGSTWLANMLTGLPGFGRYQPSGWTASFLDRSHQDIYPGLFDEIKRRLAVVKGHTNGSVENAERLRASGHKYLLTVRDPRDQVISGYWYLRNHTRHPGHKLAMELSLDAFLSHELDPAVAEIPRADWIRGWLANRDPERSLIVRYEDLLANTVAEVNRVIDFLGFQVPTSMIESIVDRNTFANTSGRAPGTEDTASFLRRGIAGEWRETFTAEHRDLSFSGMEDVINSLGYEPTSSVNQ